MTNLRPKQKEFINEYIKNNGNATQAVKEVYKIPDNNYAAVKGNRMLRNDNVAIALKDRIPDDLLIRKHKALLNKVDYKTKEIDTQAVSNGLTLAYRIKGLFIDKSIVLNVDIKPSEEELNRANQALKALE